MIRLASCWPISRYEYASLPVLENGGCVARPSAETGLHRNVFAQLDLGARFRIEETIRALDQIVLLQGRVAAQKLQALAAGWRFDPPDP